MSLIFSLITGVSLTSFLHVFFYDLIYKLKFFNLISSNTLIITKIFFNLIFILLKVTL